MAIQDETIRYRDQFERLANEAAGHLAALDSVARDAASLLLSLFTHEFPGVVADASDDGWNYYFAIRETYGFGLLDRTFEAAGFDGPEDIWETVGPT